LPPALLIRPVRPGPGRPGSHSNSLPAQLTAQGLRFLKVSFKIPLLQQGKYVIRKSELGERLRPYLSHRLTVSSGEPHEGMTGLEELNLLNVTLPIACEVENTQDAWLTAHALRQAFGQAGPLHSLAAIGKHAWAHEVESRPDGQGDAGPDGRQVRRPAAL
jgi:hypothetical protein